MKVWIIQTGEPLHIDLGKYRPMRAMSLANALIDAGHEVTIISSIFFHQERRHRVPSEFTKNLNERLRITLIPSRGYSRNVGIGRLIDHGELGVRFKKIADLLVEKTGAPDFLYVGFPPIELAFSASLWGRKKGIPLMVNVEDQWPDIFEQAVHPKLRWLIRIFFWPYKYLATKCLARANILGAVSKSYLNWSLRMAGRSFRDGDQVIYLTGSRSATNNIDCLEAEKFWRDKNIDLSKNGRIIFVGTISRGFDFKSLGQAIRHLNKDKLLIEFVICGIGEEENAVKKIFEGVPGVHFPGWIDGAAYALLAKNSLCTVAPYCRIPNFQENIPNKVIDSFSYEKPILTSLGGEVGNLINEKKVGFSNLIEDKDWIHAISTLFFNDCLARKYSENAKKLYFEKFESSNVYGKLISSLEKIVNDKITTTNSS